MVDSHAQFIQRLRKMGLSRQRSPNQRVSAVIDAGVLGVVPRPHGRRDLPPLRGIVLLAVGFIGFKTLMLAAVGPATYADRLAKLEGGTIVEQAGALLLAIDPVTAGLAKFTGPILR